MFVIIIDPNGFKWYYAVATDGTVYRWDQTVKSREWWEIVPWIGF